MIENNLLYSIICLLSTVLALLLMVNKEEIEIKEEYYVW